MIAIPAVTCYLFPPIQVGSMEEIACLSLFACFCWLVFACLGLLAYVCLRVLACCFCWLVCACLLLLACVCLRVLACFFLLVFACLLLLACVCLLLLRNRIRWAGSVSELLSDVSRSPPAPTIRNISEYMPKPWVCTWFLLWLLSSRSLSGNASKRGKARKRELQNRLQIRMYTPHQNMLIDLYAHSHTST